jgi:hypothetical protein
MSRKLVAVRLVSSPSTADRLQRMEAIWPDGPAPPSSGVRAVRP